LQIPISTSADCKSAETLKIDEKITNKTENICLKRNFLYYCSVIQTPMHHEKASFTPYLCPHGIGYAGPKQ
jgi:hypothetical protein